MEYRRSCLPHGTLLWHNNHSQTNKQTTAVADARYPGRTASARPSVAWNDAVLYQGRSGMTVDLDLSPGTRSLWAGKAIPWEHLEEEVALLWKMAADNMRIGQNMSVRTSVLNLVIC